MKGVPLVGGGGKIGWKTMQNSWLGFFSSSGQISLGYVSKTSGHTRVQHQYYMMNTIYVFKVALPYIWLFNERLKVTHPSMVEDSLP